MILYDRVPVNSTCLHWYRPLTSPSFKVLLNLPPRQILAVMTVIDTLFLLTSMAEFSFVEAFHLTSTEYDTFFVYFLYPMHNVFLTW